MRFLLVSASAFALAACSQPQTAGLSPTAEPSFMTPTTTSPLMNASTTSERERQVIALLKSIETGDPAPAAVINAESYTQHNLAIGDGIGGFVEALQQLPAGSARVNTVRVFEDGDYVFAHTDYNFFGPKIGFDLFRFEDGKIVEHWDNLQETAGPNPSGRTMTGGPTAPTDLDKTEANKALVRRFVDDILINGRMNELVGYFDGDTYSQHNPQIADGLSGLGAALQALAEQGVTMEYETIHTVLGEGNFVLVVSEGAFGGVPTSFYDLFRVEDGKIAEHWDVVEPILPRSEWRHDNGKFSGLPN